MYSYCFQDRKHSDFLLVLMPYSNCCGQLILPRPFGHLLNNKCLQMIPSIFSSFLKISISTMLNNFTTFLETQVQISCLLYLRVFDVSLPLMILVEFLLYLLTLFYSYYFVHMSVLFSVNYCIFFFCIILYGLQSHHCEPLVFLKC